MTKRILKTILWNRLFNRFKTEHLEKEIPTLLETVQPITDFDALASESKVLLSGDKTPGAVGTITMHTVPDGKRWIVRNMYVSRKTGVSLTISAITLVDVSENNAMAWIEMFAATTAYTTLFDGQEIKMNEGDLLQVNIFEYTEGDILISRILVDEEDAY